MLSEADLEIWMLDELAELEWESVPGATLAPGSGQRTTWNDIVLHGRLLQSLRNLNPGVPEAYLQQAITEVITPKSQSAIAENERLHKIGRAHV